MKVGLPIHSYRRASATVGGGRLLNCFAESSPPEGKGPTILLRAPGNVQLTSISAATGRGCFTWNGQLYAVVGQKLYSVGARGETIEIGDINGSSRVTFGTNSDELIICAPPFAYHYTGGVLSQVTDGDFRTPAGMCTVDGYAVFREEETSVIYCSDLNDASSYDALYYESVEGLPGNVTGIANDHRQIVITKRDCTEIWEDVGGSGFPFARAINGFVEMGTEHGDTLCKADNSLYVLCTDKTIRRLEGLTWVRKSTYSVEQAIRSYDLSECFGFSYTQDGHIFVVFTFPASEATWVYDVTTNEWHERESAGKRWRPMDASFAYGKPFVQRYDTGAIGYLDPDVYTDCGDAMAVEWTYGAVYDGMKIGRHNVFECVLETGYGMDADALGAGYILGYFSGGFGSGVTSGDPQILLYVSNDGGREWKQLPPRSLGELGKRKTRVRWFGLGSGRDRVYKVRVTDPVKIVVTDTQLEVA